VNYRQFFILIEGTADAAFAVDTAGRISAWNKAATELFGLNESEAIGVKCHQMLQCSDENGVVCSDHCLVECAAQNNLSHPNFDLRVQTKTGKLWCNLSVLIASDAAGARQTIYIVRPREMRKRLEQALSEFVRTLANAGPNGVPIIFSRPSPHTNVPLTAREREVLRSLAKGDSTRTIANQLNISSATVNNHIKHILTKLDAHTRLEAIRHAESAGLI
jgi:PAS domain S-box-containing protein